MKKLLLAATLTCVPVTALAQVPAAAPPAPAAAIADANPALWVVRDQDTTIYLFGTIHLLREPSRWFDGEVRRAYDASSEIVVEIADQDPQAVQQAFAARAIDPDGPPLSQKLSPALAGSLAAALQNVGVPANALETLEPWAAAMTLSALPLARLGYRAELSPDAVIAAAARADGKRLIGLETTAGQLDMLDRLSEAAQIQMLANALGAIDTLGPRFDQMIAAWSRGDAERATELVAYTMAGAPELEQAMVIARNARWADWIQRRLQQPGTVFIAAGTAHFAGAHSVQRMLAQRGVAGVRRVE